jgi:hypothetical protein
MVRGAVWGELVSGKTFPDLRDFSGNIAFWAPELLLILLGNDGLRPSGTQISQIKNREFISP